ncbi:MAG: glycosyltransferase family 4 protein, partial [Planctomycetota bacterium]|jgi:alpha-1,3-rhamnosyl/mannosyltransferase
VAADRILGGCDLYHHTNFLVGRVSSATPQVMTLHDLAFLRDPSCHTPRAVRALKRVLKRALVRCAAFLVPSKATARDCEALLGLGRDRLFVTPLGVEDSFFDLGRESQGYLLAVGTLEPRKNHARLIRAFGRLDGERELRIAGGRGWLCDEVVRAAEATPGVRLLGHLDDTALRAQLAGAAAVAYPSLLEGFGLPLLEAMAAGKPVLTSDRDPLRTVAGGAALLVDPEDEDALAEGLERLLSDSDLRARLAAAGPERARQFTWTACAAATMRAYEAVL